MNVGTIIIQTMCIEIVVPHIFPLLQVIGYGVWRCLNRSCTCDRRRSKYLLQSDYEDLYTGPEFTLDYRLAQIVAFTWVSFMFGPGMPILFPISAIAFIVMYWIDKWLVLRFYRLPKNFDSETIKYSIEKMKYAFVFHLIVGYLILSSQSILSSSDTVPAYLKKVDRIQ